MAQSKEGQENLKRKRDVDDVLNIHDENDPQNDGIHDSMSSI